MANLDFVTNDELRSSLESDYRELQSAMSCQAYKAVHVLAGSVIEAVLVDYLIAIDYQSRAHKDPLNMTFEKLIEACKDERIISSRIADLSTVIRSYRNLIHPARLIRLNEKADINGAKIAQTLVDMILEEISTQKQMTYGYNALQVISKIEKDSSVIPILRDILKNMSRLEQEKLLTMIPERYKEARFEEEHVQDFLYFRRLEDCFRVVFLASATEAKRKVSQYFVQLIKEGSDTEIVNYANAFFMVEDIQFLSNEEGSLVKRYLIHQGPVRVQRSINELGAFLSEEEAVSFTNAVIAGELTEDDMTSIDRLFKEQYQKMNDNARKAVINRLDEWLNRHKNSEIITIVSKLKRLVSPFNEELPF